MSKWPDDFVKYVLDDVEKYKGKTIPVKASIWERLFVKKISPKKLHPNPVDEFTWESVGPSFEIVGRYADQIRRNMSFDRPIFDEPLIVEKITPDGYMLINGHHRWFASIRAGAPKVLIDIVNLTHVEDIILAINRSKNHKSVAFDLDEVLVVGENGFEEEPLKRKTGSKVVTERLRAGVCKVIPELQKQGYDVWVYTATYQSEEYLKTLFKLYNLKVDGIINGFNRKKDEKAENTRELFLNKYTHQLHIDNESLICTYTKEKDFDQVDFENGKDHWADDIISALTKIRE